jgi:hypothetical protein
MATILISAGEPGTTLAYERLTGLLTAAGLTRNAKIEKVL